MALIYGAGPVLEAIRSGARHIDRILFAEGAGNARLREIHECAKRAGIPTRREPRVALDCLAGTAHHQGVVAITAASNYAEPSELIDKAAPDTVLVLLDGIEDPHNLGAIIRTAECAGASGVVIPERRAAHITESVVKASAGATEHLPVARAGNLAAFIEELKKHGFWVIGVEPAARQNYTDFDYRGPLAIVLGSEGKGLHRLIREKCDVLVSLPMKGHVESLNVSVAAGIVLYEALRRRTSEEP